MAHTKENVQPKIVNCYYINILAWEKVPQSSGPSKTKSGDIDERYFKRRTSSSIDYYLHVEHNVFDSYDPSYMIFII